MATARKSIASCGCFDAQAASGNPSEHTAARPLASSNFRVCAASQEGGSSRAISMKSRPYRLAAATATSAPLRVQFIAHMLVWTPNPRIPPGLAKDSSPQKIEMPRYPSKDHHADQQQTPDGGGEVLAGAKQVQARGQELQDDQRQNNRQDLAEAAEGIDAAKKAREHGDQQVGLAVTDAHRIEPRHHDDSGD